MKGPILVLIALLLVSCGEKKEEAGAEKPTAFVSIPPQAGLLKALAGDRMSVQTLVGEGQSPHAFEPTARQLAALGKSRLLFTIGLPFEHALLEKIKPLYPNLTLINTQQDIELIAMPHEGHSDACDHDHDSMDPHVWLSPKNAMTISRSMLQALEKADPDNAPYYRKKFTHLMTELDVLDSTIRKELAPYKGSRFYVFHPSFGYFAHEYGLEQVPIELEGKSPSPRQLSDLIKQARADGVKIIFVQKQFPLNSAKAIADEINGTVVQLDPLAQDSIANLKQIAESIGLALKR